MTMQQVEMKAGAGLRIARWADDDGIAGVQRLAVELGIRPEQMHPGAGTGESLVSNGMLGADIVRLGAGERFQPHTHAADHLLIVIGGLGTITCDGAIYPTRAGEIYMIDGGAACGGRDHRSRPAGGGSAACCGELARADERGAVSRDDHPYRRSSLSDL
jgi:mannose-6-phosphate isomerase-like protein (cupin superfamily)